MKASAASTESEASKFWCKIALSSAFAPIEVVADAIAARVAEAGRASQMR